MYIAPIAKKVPSLQCSETRNIMTHELYAWQNVTKFGHFVRKIFNVRCPKKEKRGQKSLILNPAIGADHPTLIVVG